MRNYRRLLDICDFQGGTQPPKDEWVNTPQPGYIRMLQIRDYSQGDPKFIEYVKDTGKLHKCTKEDIMLSRYGYIGQAFTGVEGAYNVALVKVVKLEPVLNSYLYYYFQSPYFQHTLLSNVGSRATIPGFNKTEFEKALIPMPTDEEQQSIAERLQKVDNLVEKHKQQIFSLDELVKSRFVELFGNPASNPMCWDECLLGERCEIITGNTPSRADEDNYGNYIEWIKSDNINTPYTYLTVAEEYLSEKGVKKGRVVGAGSVLMTCIAGSIGCIGNVAIADREVAFNQQINAIIPSQDEPLYIYWLMQLSKPYIQSTVNMSLKGILSKGKLSQLDFPFPPVKLQKEFSDFVRINEKTKSAVQKSIDELETLKKSLMQKYFG